MSSSNSSSGSITTSLLLVAFIVLKLTDQIDWSWWWVLSPLWIPIALILIVSIAIYSTDAFKDEDDRAE